MLGGTAGAEPLLGLLDRPRMGTRGGRRWPTLPPPPSIGQIPPCISPLAPCRSTAPPPSSYQEAEREGEGEGEDAKEKMGEQI